MRMKKEERLRKEFDSEFGNGFLLTDMLKRNWTLGELIGRGGFGNVYAIYPSEDPKLGFKDFCAKIEPHSNGPLFTEIAFYQRVASAEKINNWLQSKKSNFIGIPQFCAAGQNMKCYKPHRFIILPRLGLNVQSIWLDADKNFSKQIIYQLGYRLLECLEYIHHFGYSHGDIKLSNLMTGYNDPLNSCRLFLMDFGLATRFAPDFKHKPYTVDPKRKHDGTIEYTSIDAHDGAVVSRRGDLLNLFFVLLHLFIKVLPWGEYLSDKDKVHKEKLNFLNNPRGYLSSHVVDVTGMDGLFDFLSLISKLKYEDSPDYNKLFAILHKSISQISSTYQLKIFSSGLVDFESSSCKTATKRRKLVDSTKKVNGTDAHSPRRNPLRYCKM